MKALQDLQLFVRAAKASSLSAAARGMDISPAAASLAVKRLEAELDVQLMVRSTRSLRLTNDGELFLRQCEQALELLTDACDNLSSGRKVVCGQIQLSAPSDLGRNLVLPWLQLFRDRYPLTSVRLQLSDRIAAIHSEQVDIALRYGYLPDSTFVALPIAPDNRRVLCASPRYVQYNGAPATPDDLSKHNCLCFMVASQAHDHWRFTKDGEERTVTVHGSFLCDDGDAVHRLALLGEGIAFKSWLDVADDVRAGRLVRLCPDWEGERAPLSMVCSNRRQLSPAVRQLLEFLQERCAMHAKGTSVR